MGLETVVGTIRISYAVALECAWASGSHFDNSTSTQQYRKGRRGYLAQRIEDRRVQRSSYQEHMHTKRK